MKKTSLFLLIILFPAHSFAKDINSIYPYPKAAWNKSGQFTITNVTKLVIPDSPTQAQLAAIASLQTAIEKQVGYRLSVTSIGSYSGTSGIIIGEANTNTFLQNHLKPVMPSGESMPFAQGYVLDISSSEILISGSDTDGTFNAIATLTQLFTTSGQTITINSAHVWDYPDYPARWVFSTHNLLVPAQVSLVENIADTMSLYKLNGLQQNDFKYSILQIMGPNYFHNADSLKAHVARENIEIIPGVIGLGWSSGILYNDPNLAEGLPASATFVMESDTGRLVPNPQTVIANGDFENITNNQFTGWNGGGSFYDGPNISAFVDNSVFHSGTTSARCTNFAAGNAGGNCRFAKLVNCDSNKSYSMSAWIKTQNLQGGNIQMLALGGVSGQSLTFTQLSIPSTAEWTRVEVNFNSLGNTSIRLYVGIWGGISGTMWIDDFAVHESGLCNVLRRTGTPVTVQNKNTGNIYTEGIDYIKIVDPKVESNKDNYFPYHTPPIFKRIAGGAIKNGDSVMINYYHPFAAISDNSGNGSVMACVSEDTLYKILGDQITRVNNLYHPSSFFMGHDEIRNMNHDKICLGRHKSPTDLLSDNMTRCHDIIRATSLASDILMWSDMVDSLHNAYKNYYLINGDLTGDWNTIPKDITIVNWNGGNSKASLQFFEHYGFKQISSPYYDVGNTSTIRAWRIAQEGVSNVRGMMYTTWQGDYNFLRPFAYYAWGAGPNIIHTPLDTSVLGMSSFPVTAQIIRDPFDNTDAIASAKMTISDSIGTTLNTLTLTNSGGNTYVATVPNTYQNGFRYFISATNKQGITRNLPTYIIGAGGSLPEAPTLISPVNNSQDTLMMQILKWNSVASANKYRIQVSLFQNFSSVIVDSISTTTVLPMDFPANKMPYYWRVQAISDVGAGAWSGVWKFSILCVPPIPTPLSPLDSTTIYSDTTILTWTTSAWDQGFDLQVSTNAQFSNNFVDVTNLTNSSYIVSLMSPGRQYFWHVKASSSPTGNTPWSVTKKYKTSPSFGIAKSKSFDLSLTNHPNPSRSETTIDFTIPHSGIVTLRLFDILGREIKSVLSEYRGSGTYEMSFKTTDLAEGTYILKLETSDGIITKRIQIIK